MKITDKIKNAIKQAFGHNENRVLQETGNYVLGGSTLSKLNQYKSTYELLAIGDFVRCIQILSNDFGKIEIFQQERAIKNPFWVRNNKMTDWEYLLNVKPNEELSPLEFRKVIIWNLFLYGAAAIFINKDKNGKVVELIPIFRNFIKREVIEGVPQYKINFKGWTETNASNLDRTNTPNEDVIFSDEEIIWIPYEILDNYSNVEFRTLYSAAINKLQQNEVSIMNSLTNDIGFSILVKTKGASNEDQKKQIAFALKQAAQMQKENGLSAMVIDDKLEIQPNNYLTTSPVSMDLRKYVATEIANKFGIPASMLGIETPNQAISQMRKMYLDNGLEPLLNLIVSKISYSVFKNEKIKRFAYSTMNLSGLDLKEKIASLSQAINNGILTPNEARALMGVEPVENGNELFTNAAIIPLEILKDKMIAETNKLKAEEQLKEEEKNTLKIDENKNENILN